MSPGVQQDAVLRFYITKNKMNNFLKIKFSFVQTTKNHLPSLLSPNEKEKVHNEEK